MNKYKKAFCGLVACMIVFPGCNGDRARVNKYILEIPKSLNTARIANGELQWQERLRNRFKFKGKQATYMLTDIVLLKDGEEVRNSVFRNTGRKDQYYILLGKGQVIVDFGSKMVGTAGCGGISFHRHSGNRMVLCLNYSLQEAMGVAIGDPKGGLPEPSFSSQGRKVEWQYWK